MNAQEIQSQNKIQGSGTSKSYKKGIIINCDFVISDDKYESNSDQEY